MAGDSSAVYRNDTPDVGSSPYNQLKFIVENAINGYVNTAIPVIVNSCTAPGPGGASGYVSATPLICQRGSDGNALKPVTIPKLPFYRAQSGKTAIVIDPKPGDIGLAIFAQQDSSKVKEGMESAETPGSYRKYSMSDGFYLGGFVNAAPETYLYFDDDKKEITLKAEKFIIEAPLTEVKGRMVQTGELSPGNQGSEFRNGFVNIGGQIVSNGIVVETHTHTGVRTGSDSTGGPQ